MFKNSVSRLTQFSADRSRPAFLQAIAKAHKAHKHPASASHQSVQAALASRIYSPTAQTIATPARKPTSKPTGNGVRGSLGTQLLNRLKASKASGPDDIRKATLIGAKVK